MSGSFSLAKTVNLMAFYSKIISQLFTVWKLSVKQLTVLPCSITVFYH